MVEGGVAVSVGMGRFRLGKGFHQISEPGGGGVVNSSAAAIVLDGDIDVRILKQLQGCVGFAALGQHH